MRTRVAIGEDPRGSIGAATAKGREFFHPVRQGNTLEKVALEGAAVGVSVESHESEVLLVRVDHPLHKGNQPLEKLSFIHDENLEPEDILESNVVQVAHCDTRSSLVVVRGNLVRAVTSVIGMLNDENGHVQRGIPGKDAEDPRGLARKHRT
jgi:hypothetical protein